MTFTAYRTWQRFDGTWAAMVKPQRSSRPWLPVRWPNGAPMRFHTQSSAEIAGKRASEGRDPLTGEPKP
ncbi:MAG: hypothetical protein AAFY19_03255 [Pseudomonadota bacterium]